jgi:RNA polymerase sigma factor (sigma-70 family)
MTPPAPSSSRYLVAVDVHKDLVYAAALRQLRNSAAAEDATQAVFLLLFKKLPSLPETRPLAPWLLTVTRYICKDAQKRDRRRRLHQTRSAMNTPVEFVIAPDPDLQHRLDDALAALSKNERDVLVLRFLQQLDVPAVSAALHITESNAKKRITRALANLRDHFTRHNIHLSSTAVATALAHAAAIHAPSHLAITLATLTTKTASAASLAMSRAASNKLLLASLKLPAAVTALIAASAVTAMLLHTPHSSPPILTPIATSAPATTFTAAPSQPQDSPHNVQQVLDAISNQYANFPQHYRAITMDVGAVLPRTKRNPGSIQHMEIIWSNGNERLYKGYYGNGLSPNATPAQILDWVSANEPFLQRLQTPTLRYDWRHYINEKPTVQLMGSNDKEFVSPSEIPYILWPAHYMAPNFTLVPQNSETPEGCVGLHYKAPDNGDIDFYVDPHKDYLPQTNQLCLSRRRVRHFSSLHPHRPSPGRRPLDRRQTDPPRLRRPRP